MDGKRSGIRPASRSGIVREIFEGANGFSEIYFRQFSLGQVSFGGWVLGRERAWGGGILFSGV